MNQRHLETKFARNSVFAPTERPSASSVDRGERLSHLGEVLLRDREFLTEFLTSSLHPEVLG